MPTWDSLPHEVVEHILDFTGILEETKKHFADMVKPQILRHTILHEIKRKQKEHPELYQYDFVPVMTTSTMFGGNSNVNIDICVGGECIMNLRIEDYAIVDGDADGWYDHANTVPLFRWFDCSWYNLDSLLQCLIRYLEGEDLPDPDCLSPQWEWY